LHDDYPFLAENTMFAASPYMRKFDEKFNLNGKKNENSSDTHGQTPKLIQNLKPKQSYVAHHAMLHCALKHGFILTDVEEIMQYDQANWMKSFQELCTTNRKAAAAVGNKLEETMWKLIANIVFGKSCENVRNRTNVKLRKDDWLAQRDVNSPLFKGFHQYANDLIGIHKQNKQVVLNKPIAVGQAILDLSKVAMYTFLYDVMKVRYGEKVRVCYSDTDSLILQIKTVDVYSDMREPNMVKHFDCSEYPQWHSNYSIINKKVPQKMKDEMQGTPMEFFVGLRSKMYYCATPNLYNIENEGKLKNFDKQALKGVHKFEINKTKLDNYMKCLFSNNYDDIIQKYNVTTMDSSKHVVTNNISSKIKMCPYEDKRYYINSCHSLAHGNHNIK
jgi:hypothetical protein